MFSQALRYFVPVGVTVFALEHHAPKVYAKEDTKCKCKDDTKGTSKEDTKAICKDEWPPITKIRSLPADCYSEPPRCLSEQNQARSELEQFVMTCRKELGPAWASFNEFAKDASVEAGTVLCTLKRNYDYLKGDAPMEAKTIAIVSGGLVGMLFAIRKSWFRKLVFTAAGAGGTAALVYPEEAKFVYTNGWDLSKKYSKIAYNFILGTGTTDGGC